MARKASQAQGRREVLAVRQAGGRMHLPERQARFWARTGKMKRYSVETADNSWSYIIGPDGYREGPWRYKWEAEEYADKLESGELKELTASDR